MRKVISVALGLTGVGLFNQTAFAAPNCIADYFKCGKDHSSSEDTDPGATIVKYCAKPLDKCMVRNAYNGYDSKGNPIPPAKPPNTGDNGAGGGSGSGSGGSKPKQVDGKTQRTADGGTVMVTPEGKEWVWNGKYNLVASYEHDGKIPEYHSVKQGDPDAPSRMVNGRMMKVSDPRYMAEAAAAVAKQQAEEAAKQAARQKAASKQTKDSIEAAKDPNGILKRGGTKIIKEDVDDPPGTSAKTGSHSAASNAATSIQPSTANPVIQTTAGSGAGGVKNKPPAVSTPVSVPPPPSAANNPLRPQGGSTARHAQ